MKSVNEQHTLMYQEAMEAAERVRQQLALNEKQINELANYLRSFAPTFVVTCARGSSGHAASYAKYLIETRLGVPTMSMAPSVHSVFNIQLNMSGALFLAISQSGQSPDILMAAKVAKNNGAFIVAIVNNKEAPLAKLADMTVLMHAGIEKSIAATKTFICTLSVLVNLVAAWQKNKRLTTELSTLPDMLGSAFKQDWSAGVNGLKHAKNLFMVSRGLGFGIVKEASLKLKEICGLHAEAFSAAEVKHGPMALVKQNFPVLFFSLQDQTQPSIDDTAYFFIERSEQIYSAGKSYEGATNFDTWPCESAELRPILLIQSFYKFANALSLARGYNPESPPYLSKVTETL